MLIDVHAHLDDERFEEDLDQVIATIKKANILVINSGADLDSSRLSVNLAKDHPFIFASVGVHPHSAKDVPKDYLHQLEEMAREEKVVALGEIGLDYHYDFSPRQKQKQVFKEQMALARDLDLPIVVHSRKAHQDTLDLVRESGITRGLMHCYSGSLELGQEYVDLGFYFSFGGMITFRKAKRPKEVAANLPLERILLETDSPYMTPEPYRGRRNDPTKIIEVAKGLAKLRGISLEKVVATTSANAQRLFSTLLKQEL